MTPKISPTSLSGCYFPVVAALIALAALLVLAVGASAQTWNETGDAGSLPTSAQITLGTDPLTTINGDLASDSDVDMYCIKVLTPGSFLARLQCVTDSGPTIYLFDASGNGVSTNAICSGGSKTITGAFVLGAGTYYVAVAYTGVEPASASGPIWILSGGGEHAPDGPGAAGPVTSWQGTGMVQQINPYEILLTSAGYCDVPPVPVEERTWGRVKAMYN